MANDFFKSSNPTLSEKTFDKFDNRGSIQDLSERMTIDGTVNKTALLLVLLLASASFTWYMAGVNPTLVMPLMLAGLFGGLISAIVIAFKQTWVSYLAPIYAILEGLFLGGISLFFAGMYAGIVLQAVGITIAVAGSLLFLYKTGMVVVDQQFRTAIMTATMAIMAVYLISMVLSFFGTTIPYIHQGGIIGILFSLFVVGIAAANLLLDFDFIEKGAESGAPKYMEWYGAFALMVTLVWLYLEILKLLAKLRGRD